MLPSINDIPFLLTAAMSGKITEIQVSKLIRIAHTIASIRLSQLKSFGKLHIDTNDQSLNMVALDCIAEMFQRDSNGYFTEFMDYFFGERDIVSLTESEIISYFRQLVFVKLKDGLFRIYHENDPVLANIIRNIKYAISKNENVETFDRLGRVYICPRNQELNQQLPEYPIEELESELFLNLNGNVGVTSYLKVFIDLLNSQENYRKFYSLIDFSVIIKRIITAKKVPLENIVSLDNEVFKIDLKEMINISSHNIREMLISKYLKSGKIPREILNKYLGAIEDVINDIFIKNDGREKIYFDYLKKYFPEMEYDDYHDHHRTQFEYMMKLAKNHTKEQLKSYFDY